MEPANQILFRGDVPVPLAPKAFDTLVYLVEHHGRLVTREELMKAIWPDSFVEDANLTVYISLLRKALGEEGERKYIETVPRKGYRMTAAVTVLEDKVTPEEPVEKVELPSRRHFPILAAAGALVLVVAALWLGFVLLRHTPQVRRVRLTSFGPELAVTAASLSPDGKLVAYANAGGIFVQPVDTGDAHPLVAPTAFTALSISWFPNSTGLLVGGFTAQANTPSLWVVEVVGKSPPVKLGVGLNGAVSSDGKLIAMTASQRWSLPEIRLMRSDGEGLRTLVSASPGEVFGPVAWMGGGRRLVWVRYRWDPQLRRNSGSIDTYELESGKMSVVLNGSDFTGDVAAISGDRIVYSQLLGGNPSSKYGSRLSAVDMRSRSVPIADSPEPITGLSANTGGNRLVIQNTTVEHSAFVADVSPGARELTNIRRLTLGLGREDFPRAWTPDSRSVIFDSNRNGTWEVFRQDLEAATDQPVVHSGNDSFSPRLSPDGSSLLFIDRPKNWTERAPVSIMRMPVAGGPAQRVLEQAGISQWGLRFECASVPGRPCVLAEQRGNQIVFRTFDPVRGFDAGTDEVTRIDLDPAHPMAWTIAPDGLRLAWVRWEVEQARIHIVPLTRGAKQNAEVIVNGCAQVHSMHWAADGKGWFLTSEWPVSWAISYASLDGGFRVLARGSGTHAPDVFPSPDERHLAFSEQIRASNVWLLDDF